MSSKNRKILILDDESGVLSAYQAILGTQTAAPVIRSSRGSAAVAQTPQTEEAFEIECVQTGEAALEAIQKAVDAGQPFAGGFFDVKLGGGIDGIETIRQAKDLDPGLLCCVVTAYQDRSVEEITRVFGDEFSDRWNFIPKPFTKAEIQQMANKLVADWDRRKREADYLTQLKLQQKQLVESERLAAVGTLSRGIGHEFGNLILTIMGNAELALRLGTVEEMEKALKLVVQSSERAGVIVRNLQSMVRTETSKKEVDLNQPVESALNLIEFELKKSSIQLQKKLASGLPPVSINQIEIGQVFLNLFINAIHSMQPKGGTLAVETAVDGDNVVVRVTDEGCGIEAEHLEKIFEPLFTTKGEKGSGIGLSVTRKIVHNHEGQIEVQSVVGKGTTFTLRLPKA